MEAPRIEIFRTKKDSTPAVEIVVRNSLANDELHALVESLGYLPTVGISNRRSIICTTPEEIDAARNPLVKFFDQNGDFCA